MRGGKESVRPVAGSSCSMSGVDRLSSEGGDVSCTNISDCLMSDRPIDGQAD